jgi:threonine synthase
MREFGGTRLDPVQAETRATAIRIGSPAIWKKAVKILRDTNGCCEDVTDEEIALAKAEIGSEGIGCEPASATTLAGLKKLVRSGVVEPGDTAVLILTGHVLKDPEYALDFHCNRLEASPAAEAAALRKPPVVLEPSADAVIGALMRARA